MQTLPQKMKAFTVPHRKFYKNRKLMIKIMVLSVANFPILCYNTVSTLGK